MFSYKNIISKLMTDIAGANKKFIGYNVCHDVELKFIPILGVRALRVGIFLFQRLYHCHHKLYVHNQMLYPAEIIWWNHRD